jgi:hypothetical protein
VADPGQPRRSRRARIVDALIWGAVLGGSSGAVLGAAIDGVGAGAGALAGAAVMATVETLIRITRRPGQQQQPPLWGRILASALLMALLGWALGLVFVYVVDERLRTDHSFSLAGQRFLTLRYEIERLVAPAGTT